MKIKEGDFSQLLINDKKSYLLPDYSAIKPEKYLSGCCESLFNNAEGGIIEMMMNVISRLDEPHKYENLLNIYPHGGVC